MKEIKLLSFSMTTCNPCQTLKPILKELSEEGVDIEFIDAKDDIQKSSEYGIRKVPSIIILKEDKEVFRFVGIKSKAEIKDLLKELNI